MVIIRRQYYEVVSRCIGDVSVCARVWMWMCVGVGVGVFIQDGPWALVGVDESCGR